MLVLPEGKFFGILWDPHFEVDVYVYMVVATIIERKLRSMKVRLFTVPCCSIIIPVSSERWEKTYSQLTPNFFVVLYSNSCLCSIIVFSPIFLTFTNSVL